MGMSERTAIKTARELSSWPGSDSIRWQRFNYCQAWTSQCLRNRFYLIKSYRTIVGIVDDQEGDFFELGKYSQTTSKQVTQIHNRLFPDTKRQLIGRVDKQFDD